MFKSEKGDVYVNWTIAIIGILILAAITIRVLVGPNGLIRQKREEKVRNQTEKNIMIELIDETTNS